VPAGSIRPGVDGNPSYVGPQPGMAVVDDHPGVRRRGGQSAL